MKMCRFCLDGIGEMADIACCNAWYLTEDDKSNFIEADGRNKIICRSKQGVEIVQEQEAFALGKLVVKSSRTMKRSLSICSFIIMIEELQCLISMLQ